MQDWSDAVRGWERPFISGRHRFKPMVDEHEEIVTRLVDSGLDEKEARVVVSLSNEPPAKASEIGKMVGITRMDAYNTLRRLQEKGLIRATVDKPMRFAGMQIQQVFHHLIHREEQELRRLQDHLEALKSGMPEQLQPEPPAHSEPTFTVVKDRQHIYAAIERIAREATGSIWVMLGRFGILHFVKSGALAAINEQAKKGLTVRVIADVEARTLRFFDQLADEVHVLHSDQLDLQGCIVDHAAMVQSVVVDPNPVGRGREDSALVVEAPEFIEAQLSLVRKAWDVASSLEHVRSRLTDGRIIDPLQVTLGEGSFYQRLKQSLSEATAREHPDGEHWINAVLRRPGEPLPREFGLKGFAALGIDTNVVLRKVGQRIGEEIAMELRDIEADDAFLAELSNRWQTLGLGALEFSTEPDVSVRVHDGGSCGGAPDLGLPFCHLDEGMLEGVLGARFGVERMASARRCTSAEDPHCAFDITFAVDASSEVLADAMTA